MEKFVVLKMDWKDLEKMGYDSVTDYCRYLVEADPENLPGRIEMYRGEMLCLSVFDVKEASELEPRGRGGFQKYRQKGRKAP